MSRVKTRWRRVSLPLRVFLIVAGGLLLGFLAAVTGFGGHVQEPLAAATTCNVSAGTANIVLGDGLTALTVNASDDLFVQVGKGGTPMQCGSNPLGTAGGDITALSFSVATGTTADTVVFNETSAVFPCVSINGPVGAGTANDALVEIEAASNTDVTVGAKTFDVAGCGASQGQVTGVGSYTLIANGTDTLSALGESSDPVTVPVSFVAGQTSPGDTESFEESNASPATTLDFSAVYSTCPPPTSSCALVVNDSGADLTTPSVADFNAVISDGSTVLTTYDFSANGEDVSNVVGLASGPTSLYGEAASYTLTGLQPGSQVVAGAGTETYKATGSFTTFTSGSDTDTFQVTGNNNTFQAGPGSDTFYDTLPTGVTTPVNTVDFTDVLTSPGAELAVNAAGAPETVNGGTLMTGEAAVGAPTGTPPYTFLDGPSSSDSTNFTTIMGAGNGSTEFLVGESGGLTLTGQGTGNSAQVFGNSGVVANLSGASQTTSAQIGPSTALANFTLTAGQVLVSPPGTASTCTAAPADCDTLNGNAGSIETLTGPGSGYSTFYAGAGPGTYTFSDQGGNNTFYGGSGVDTFTGSGNNNDFVAGTGNGSFTDPGSGNTVDFSALPVSDQVTVDVSGLPVLLTPNDAATGSGATYTFGASATTFLGSPGGTIFDAGGTADTFVGSPSATNQLNFAFSTQTTTGPLHVCLVKGSGCSAGEALLGSVDEQFKNINQFTGLNLGNTAFVASTPNGAMFTATGSNNSIDFSAASPGVTVNMPAGTVASNTTPPVVDSISGLATVFGSTAGGNKFIAGSASETFGDNGSAGNDAIDFSDVPTGFGTSLLVNVSGGPEEGGSLNNFVAMAGTALYNFSTGGPNFVTLTGSANGNTTFFAGNTGGYAFAASGGNDSIDFSAATANPVSVNLAGATTSGTVSGFATGGPDTITGLTTVTGSPKNRNSFTAGSSSATYDFIANSNGNTFVGGAGVDSFMSTGSNNTITVGTGDATFSDTAGSGNTVSFANLPPGDQVTVNVSGQPAQTPNDTATGSGATYTFGTTVTTFDGSPGGTIFDAGGAADTFNGAAGAANTLNFDNLPNTVTGPLTVCVVAGSVCPAGEALLGTVPDQFTNITTYAGLPLGNTTFVAGTPNGSTFDAFGSNDVIDFSAASSGVTVNLTAGTAGSVGSDSISGLTTVIGSAAGGNTFEAGSGSAYSFTGNGNGNTFDGGSGADTFSSNGNNNTFNVGTGAATLSDTGTGNAISFNAVPTSSSTPLNVNVSGTPVSGVFNDTASVGSVTYNFATGGTGFTTFTGAATGNTDFHAAGTAGGYSFTGAGPGNTADFEANICGVTANMLTGSVGLGVGTKCQGSFTDTIAGITTVVGSPVGDNVFDGDLLGNVFTADSATNTLSYLGFTSSGVCVNLTSNRVSLSCTGGATADSFNFAPGSLAVEGSPGNDTFQIGTANVTIEGGGGHDTIDLSQIPAPPSGTTGADVNLAAGSITGPSIGGVTFTPGCSSAADLCVTTVKGSKFDDTVTTNAASLGGLPPLSIIGGGGNDVLDLSSINSPATVEMPITGTPLATTGTCTGAPPSSTGNVCPPGGSPAITFTGIPNIMGTAAGGDYFFAGSGTESMTEIGSPGTLDYSALPVPSNPENNVQGLTVDATDLSGTPGGIVTSPETIGVTDTFTQIGTFTGTSDNDAFLQFGPGAYTFNGAAGSNTLDLSAAPAGTKVSLGAPSPNCTTGIKNNNGTAKGTEVNDSFTCMGSVVSSSSEYDVLPGQTATVDGNGQGTLVLIGAPTGQVTVTLPQTAGGLGTVTGGCAAVVGSCVPYNFSFTGMSTVDGTPYDDLFIPGNSPVTINGDGGVDGLSFAGAPAAEVVNLSSSAYTVPAGAPTDPGTTVPADTAIGGYGGTITFNGVFNVMGTTAYNDVIVGGPGSGTLIGGGGDDTFVPTGGNYVIDGGTGTNTLDLSLLPAYSTLNLGSSAVQALGDGDGSVAVAAGTIEKVIASPSGSTLQAGPGNITLVGGQGNDWLAAGTGNQTLIAGSGEDTLVAGIGNDNLEGGTQPVTFIPGQGGTDVLTSQMTSPGNTLSYSGQPTGAQVNLSSQLYVVPAPQPFAGMQLPADHATGGWGASVTLSGAEVGQIVGSPEGDVFVTGASPTTIMGNGGSDLFVVTSGDNTLTAGTGSTSRFLFSGPGGNVINGGGDSTLDFSLAPAGVNVNLQEGEATGGFGGGTQAVTGVLDVTGTNFADVLIGGAEGETLTGLNGGDLLEAGPTGGDTLWSDGNGNDTFCAQVGRCGATAAEGGNTMIGGSGEDTFFAVNGGVDHISGHDGDFAFVDPQDIVSGIPPQDINPP